jgi:hypothetical protein
MDGHWLALNQRKIIRDGVRHGSFLAVFECGTAWPASFAYLGFENHDSRIRLRLHHPGGLGLWEMLCNAWDRGALTGRCGSSGGRVLVHPAAAPLSFVGHLPCGPELGLRIFERIRKPAWHALAADF